MHCLSSLSFDTYQNVGELESIPDLYEAVFIPNDQISTIITLDAEVGNGGVML